MAEACTCDFPIAGHATECPALVAEVDPTAYDPIVSEFFFDRRAAAWSRWAEENSMHPHSAERDIFFDAWTDGFTVGTER